MALQLEGVGQGHRQYLPNPPPPNGFLIPLACLNRKPIFPIRGWLTMENSSIMITLTFANLSGNAFSAGPLSGLNFLEPLSTGRLKAE